MTLTRYVSRQLLVAFLFALAGLGLVILPTLTVKAVHEVGGVGLQAIFRFMPLVLIELVPYVLPMAFLLACVATFGRLAADNELTAIRMAGMNPGRLLWPGLVLAIPLAFLTDYLLASVAPTWKFEARSFQRRAEVEEFQQLLFERNEIDLGGFSLWAESSQGNRKQNVVLSYEDPDDEATSGGSGGGGDRMTLTAEEMVLELRDGVLTVGLTNAEAVNDSVQSVSGNSSITFLMEDLKPTKAKGRDKPKYQTSGELRAKLAAGVDDPEQAAEMRYLIQSRRALAATYILFLLLGAPTGVFLRTGTQLAAFTGAMGYAFLYYLLALRLGKELAGWGHVSPELAAWATNGIFLGLGIVFTWRGLFR